MFRKFLPSNWRCTLDSYVRDCFVSPNESRTSRFTDLFLVICNAAYTWDVRRSSILQSFGDGGSCFLWNFGHHLRGARCLISYKKLSKMHVFHVYIYIYIYGQTFLVILWIVPVFLNLRVLLAYKRMTGDNFFLLRVSTRSVA